MKFRTLLPFILFIFIGLILWRGLSLHPERVPSPLINKPAPVFSLPVLSFENKIATQKDFAGHVTLLNVWATWCFACADEHAFLLKLARDHAILIYGFDYKDDSAKARKWLRDKGDPYKTVAVDKSGTAAINWGVYGTPETFVIDKKGIIRYKFVGPLTQAAWDETIHPLVEKLKGEMA